jgi:cell shape-determining protein MreD
MLLILPLLIISILLEGTVTDIPLTLVCLLALTIMRRDLAVFVVAFFSGLIWDVMTLHRLGGASMFFLVFVFLIFLYQRKYEINSYPFASSFLGGWIFLFIFGYGNAVGQALLGSLIAVILFGILGSLKRKS